MTFNRLVHSRQLGATIINSGETFFIYVSLSQNPEVFIVASIRAIISKKFYFIIKTINC